MTVSAASLYRETLDAPVEFNTLPQDRHFACATERTELGYRPVCLGVVHESIMMQEHSGHMASCNASWYR